MNVKVLTLFPRMFGNFLTESILGRARKSGLVNVEVHDIRDYAEGRHKVADDVPYGGGAGMVMKPEPIDRCLTSVLGLSNPSDRHSRGAWVVLLSPQGKPFDQQTAARLAGDGRCLVLICGHYEGIDERIRMLWVDEELSIGDYVLTGGELAAMVVIDACARMVPGVLGHADSAANDSFMGGLLDHPHYTRPIEFRGLRVPEVLVSGHHENIKRWRRAQALMNTREKRPDMFSRVVLSAEDRSLLDGDGDGQSR